MHAGQIRHTAFTPGVGGGAGPGVAYGDLRGAVLARLQPLPLGRAQETRARRRLRQADLPEKTHQSPYAQPLAPMLCHDSLGMAAIDAWKLALLGGWDTEHTHSAAP